MNLCGAVSVNLGTTCGQLATGLYRGLCVHEHLTERWLCADHASWHEPLLCRPCHDGPESHLCGVMPQLVTTGGHRPDLYHQVRAMLTALPARWGARRTR